MLFNLMIMSAEGDYLSHKFNVTTLGKGANEWSPGNLAQTFPHHFKGICPVEAEASEQGVKLILKIDPAPDSIRCRIFLLCFASFVETLCERIYR